MYQLLAGLVIVICFVLGMNSKSFSEGKDERKVPPDPGRPEVKTSSPSVPDGVRTRENIREDLTRLADAGNIISGDENAPVRAMCYEVSIKSTGENDIQNQPSLPPVRPPAPVSPAPSQGAGDSNVIVGGNAAPKDTKSAKTASRSRESLKAELAKLARSASIDPATLIHHAMCYSPMPPRASLEYVCEKCKHKSVYNLRKAEIFADNIVSIKAIRDLVAKLSSNKLNVYLDESGCCSKCSGGKPTGDLYVEISYPDAPKPVRTKISSRDLVMIQAFLEGKDRFSTYGPDCASLKENMKRIEEILGITADSK